MNPYHCDAMKRARAHTDGWEFAAPETITFTQKFEKGALWYPPYNDDQKPCRIEIGWQETYGILWHELFHGCLYYCPLGWTEGCWFEGFCNAFAACNDGIKRPPLVLTEELWHGAANGDNWTRQYGIPEELILQHVGRGDAASKNFESFFFQLNRTASIHQAKKKGFLSTLLGYDPETGLRTPDRLRR